ncbi:hypothetical protein GCM10010178_87410 [Lentzea flava]|uniref:Uncharacterized protein n=1 Tax=Lentzea flava TaxID=103732 RepID=A0ABQ2VG27_9PSEU|nr:hypothetical protein GCM10010178_87410 [Lentzea flava]
MAVLVRADVRQRLDREGPAQACENGRAGSWQCREEPLGPLAGKCGGEFGLNRGLGQNDQILTHRPREADTGGIDL